MSAIIPPARYDLPWKAAIAHAFHDFMRLFFPTSCSKINWSIRPRFRDKELAAVGFGDASNIMVADKLIEVRLLNGQAQWILIHTARLCQPD